MDRYHSHGDRYYGVLELCLNDILSYIKPSENDRLKRLNTINELTTIVRSMESLKDVAVRPFGSFISNMYTKWGDLDTFIELSHSSPSFTGREQTQKVLRDIMRVLRRNGVARNFTCIAHARVPLLKFESNRYNVSCDLSVNNHVGWMKSRILLRISEIDDRLRDMVLLTKEWAKAHHINDPKSGTLNSYSLSLLVIFHFQTCKPPILPPLKDIYEGDFYNTAGPWSSIERQIEDVCAANIARFKLFRQRNQSTLCQLLLSFFDKFSEIGSLSLDYAICTYTGQWERISSNPRWMEKPQNLLIEDPFERPDNAARAVRLRELSMISEAFMTTSQKLSSHSVLSDRNALLECLVRPNIRARSHCNTRKNPGEPQLAYSGYVTVHEPSKVGSQRKVGTQSRSTANQNWEHPQVAFYGYAMCAPDQGKIRGVLDKHNSQFSPSVLTRQRQGYTNKWELDKPQVAFSGYAVYAPDHEKIQAAVNKHNSQSLPSVVVTPQRQMHTDNSPQVAFSGYAVYTPDCEKIQAAVNKHNSQSLPSVFVTPQRQMHTANSPQVAFSGYALYAPDHEKIQAAVNIHNSQSLPSVVITPQRQMHTDNSPQVAFSGYAVCAPDHERIQEVVNKHSSRSSPSVATQHMQGYANGQAQQIWRPKNSSR